jgi:hydrogenase-4 component F
MIFFGLLSMLTAAAFMVRQRDFKRMLAYSSVEHMGILSLAVGLGAGGAFGALLHAVNHSLTKGMLFLVAGNILALYRSKSTCEVRGVLRSLPVSGVLWVAGFLAITGSPPFGPFLSELVILKAALDQGQVVVAILYLLALSVIFVGMAVVVLRMAQGEPGGLPAEYVAPVEGASVGDGVSGLFRGELPLAVVPPLALGAVVFMLGVYIPPPLQRLLEQAAGALGAR